MPHYSEEIKKTMVAKLCAPGAPSAFQLGKKTGISQTALSRWVRELGEVTKVKNRRPEDWSPEERLNAVFEALKLSDHELGEFLRRNGLHSSTIDDWKKEISFEFKNKSKVGRPRKDPALVAAEEEIKKLKRDLNRKDRALSEQSAIIILQKKVQELWAEDEDDA